MLMWLRGATDAVHFFNNMPNGINSKKWVVVIFAILAGLTLLTPFWIFRDLLFPYITSKAYFLRITVELALPFYIYLVLRRPSFRPSLKNPLNLSVLAFLVFNVVSSIFGVNPLRSFWGNFERMGGSVYLAHLSLIYFYLVAIGQASRNFMRRFLIGVIYLSAVSAFYGLMVKLTGDNFFMRDPSYPRISATFGNPIFFASFLILPMFLTLYYLLAEENKWLKVVYGFIAALELWCIYISGTRGAIVGLVLALFISSLIYIFVTGQKRVKLWGGVALLVFSLAVGVAFTQHNKFPSGTMLARVFKLKDTNSEARLVQWGVALRGYRDYPVLGVGPENYYYISNKYYNPDIYKYDQSWFDKPHNYLIEVLVTTGALGFLAYLAMLLACVWILAIAYRQGLFSLLEACLLLAGLLTYEFQNLFVFDTISASLTFFVYLGFVGFLWQEVREEQKNKNQKNIRGLDPIFINTATVVAALGTIYLIYIANITGLTVAKDVNYGYAYGGVDPQISKNYFQKAGNSPFDFDPVQFSSKYAEAVVGLANSPGKQTAEFVNNSLKDAISATEEAIARVPNDPIAWQQLSNLYLTQSIYNKTALSPKAAEAAQKAMDLAPKRPEPILMMVRLYTYQNNFAAAESLLKGIISNIPEDREAKLQLAVMYAYQGRTDEALQVGRDLLNSGFLPSSAAQIDWMAQAYDKKGDFASAVAIYELAVKVEPGNLQDQWALAQDYAKLGKKDQAIAIAEHLIIADPPDAQHFRDFINSLK